LDYVVLVGVAGQRPPGVTECRVTGDSTDRSTTRYRNFDSVRIDA
jgi:hypothetical protein